MTAIIFSAQYFISIFYLILACIFAFSVRVEMDSFPFRLQVSLMSIIEICSTTASVVSPPLIQFGVDHNLNNIVFTHAIRFVFGTIPMIFIDPARHEIDREYIDPEDRKAKKEYMPLED